MASYKNDHRGLLISETTIYIFVEKNTYLEINVRVTNLGTP